ncbi:MAG: cob(I)yrinic acid a,c-diamide adenosyltransferase [Tyzzerella sp.]|nr:cob(I)yrinic acid a,c-diamide adenosyltransferase [Tyzzerella sp.]
MKIYTKKGDRGKTSLINEVEVSKADERIELLGTIDELNSYIGFAKVILSDDLKKELSAIQKELMFIMAGVADTDNPMYQVDEEDIHALEEKIDNIENSFEREKKLILYGGCEVSARLDLARVAARKAERIFWKIQKEYNLDLYAIQYMNRLSDYLYILARFEDYKNL